MLKKIFIVNQRFIQISINIRIIEFTLKPEERNFLEEQFVAIYLDFENLAISAEQTYPSKEKPLTLSPLVDFAANNRNICIKKAYSDWSRPLLAQYQNELNEYGFEMIH